MSTKLIAIDRLGSGIQVSATFRKFPTRGSVRVRVRVRILCHGSVRVGTMGYRQFSNFCSEAKCPKCGGKLSGRGNVRGNMSRGGCPGECPIYSFCLRQLSFLFTSLEKGSSEVDEEGRGEVSGKTFVRLEKQQDTLKFFVRRFLDNLIFRECNFVLGNINMFQSGFYRASAY